MIKRTSSIRSLPNGVPVGAGKTKTSATASRLLAGQQSSDAKQKPGEPSIDFQLSKKTAELTMIVQMLFTQLHTKEAECELWQRYYNEFGETLLRELTNERGAAASLRNTIAAQEVALNRAAEEIQLLAKDNDKLKTDCSLATERMQELSNLYQTILKEKNGLSNELMLTRNQLELQKEIGTNLQNDLAKSNQVIKTFEKREKQNMARLENELRLIQQENRDLTAELNHVKTWVDDLAALKSQAEDDKRLLQTTNDALRADYLALKEKYDAQRAAPFVNPMTQLMREAESEERRRRIASARKNLRSAAVTCNLMNDDQPTIDAEIVQLRKELQRYKLELKNRDASFNRMFAAAAQRPNQKNGNLLTNDDDDDFGAALDLNGSGDFSNNNKQSSLQLPSPNRRQSFTTTKRIPLMPAQFSSSTANSVARKSINANNISGLNISGGGGGGGGGNKPPTTLPPVQINYQ